MDVEGKPTVTVTDSELVALGVGAMTIDESAGAKCEVAVSEGSDKVEVGGVEEASAAAGTSEDKLDLDISTFPLPNSWYQPHGVAGSGMVWGYIALNTLVVVESQPNRNWPVCTLLGGLGKEAVKDKYRALSLSHEKPLPPVPLVTSSELGTVKLWCLQTKSVVKLNDTHKVSCQFLGIVKDMVRLHSALWAS